LFKATLAEQMPLGCEVTHVERLSSAVKLLASRPFDVILLDLNLPDSFGFETFERARAAAYRVPIIVLTGYLSKGMAIKSSAMRQGDDFIYKGSFTGKGMAQMIRHALPAGEKSGITA